MVLIRLAAWVGIAPFVALAAWVLWHAPHPIGCVKPTVMPATWYGDCNRRSVNTTFYNNPGNK